MSRDAKLLLAAARRLDLGDHAGAADHLASLHDLRGCAAAALALWRATLRQVDDRADSTEGAKGVFKTIETGLTTPAPVETHEILHAWRRSVADQAPGLLVVPCAQAILPMVAALQASDRHALMAAVMAEAQPALVLAIWRAALAEGADQPLDGWQAGVLIAAARAMAPGDPLEALSEELRATGRQDLLAFLKALALGVGLGSPCDIRAGIEAVGCDTQRRLVLDFLVRAPATPERFLDLAAIVDAVGACLDPPYGGPNAAMLVLRRAVATQSWADAETRSRPLLENPSTQIDAIGLRACAQIGLGRFEAAAANAGYLRDAPGMAWYDRGRGAALAWMGRMQADGTRRTGAADLPACGPGRPLAQALWVGPRLRWIERAALRSWLLNGWRMQLFVYDPPEGVPEGVELLDASAVLPRAEVFREQAASGAHRGSLGAFSDRFRYALLAQRGGLWTDTDVINLRRFEPEGVRLISTEHANVGVETLNGAILAAPPGDATIVELSARSAGIIREGVSAFARIGPQLLCETMAEHGANGFGILQTDVVNPLSWSDTRRYFDPADQVAADPRLSGAACLHVFTETWRQIGVDMESAPPPSTFLGRAVARILDAPLPAPRGPDDAVRRLLGVSSC